MRKTIFFILIIFNVTTCLFAQSIDTGIVFPSQIGGNDFIVKSFKTSNAGNHYILGAFRNSFSWNKKVYYSTGQHDLFFIKMDADYHVIWIHTLGSSNDDMPGFLLLDDNEDVYYSGFIFGTGYFDNSKKIIQDPSGKSSSYNFILKLDSSGNKRWSNFFGSTYYFTYFNVPIISSNFPIYIRDNNVFVSGFFQGDAMSYTYTPKYDSVHHLQFSSSVKLWVVQTYDLNGYLKNTNYFEGGNQFIGINNILGDNLGNIGININSSEILKLNKDTLLDVAFNSFSKISNAFVYLDSNRQAKNSLFLPLSAYSRVEASTWNNDSDIISLGYCSYYDNFNSSSNYHTVDGINFISISSLSGKIKQVKYLSDTNLNFQFSNLYFNRKSKEYYVYGHCGFRPNNYKSKLYGLTFNNSSMDYALFKFDSNFNNIWSVKIKGLTSNYLYSYNSNMGNLAAQGLLDNKGIDMEYNEQKGIIYLGGISSADSIQVYFNSDNNKVYTSPQLYNGSVVLAIADSNFVGIGPLPPRLCQGQSYSLPVAARAVFGANNKFVLYITAIDSVFKSIDSIASIKNIKKGDRINFIVPNNFKGKYKISLKSDSVLLWSNILEVVVDSVPTSSLYTSRDSVCIGDSILLRAVHSHAGKWWLPNLKKPVAKDSVYVIASTSNYYVFETDNSSCNKYDTVFIYVASKLIADAGRDTNICEGSSFDLRGKGGVYYNWSNGTDSSFTKVQINTDTLFVLTVSDSLGCKDYDTVEFKVRPLPQVSWAGFTKKQFCLEDDSLLLTNGSPNGGYFTGNGVIGNYFYPKQAGPGQQTISYNVKGSNGCTSIATDAVNITKPPLALLNITGTASKCEGDSFILFNLDTAHIKKFQWSTGDTSKIITVKNAGVYTLIVTDTIGCTNTSSIMHLVFNPTPYVYIIYANGKLVGISNPKVKAWFWQLDGNMLPNDSTAEIANPTKGKYSLKVTDSNSCTGFSPTYIFTAIEDIYTSFKVEYIYGENLIYIYKPVQAKYFSWQLYDALGRKVSEGDNSANPIALDMTRNPKGLYTLIFSLNGLSTAIKLLW